MEDQLQALARGRLVRLRGNERRKCWLLLRRKAAQMGTARTCMKRRYRLEPGIECGLRSTWRVQSCVRCELGAALCNFLG